jgi:hypothetical protein
MMNCVKFIGMILNMPLQTGRDQHLRISSGKFFEALESKQIIEWEMKLLTLMATRRCTKENLILFFMTMGVEKWWLIWN